MGSSFNIFAMDTRLHEAWCKDNFHHYVTLRIHSSYEEIVSHIRRTEAVKWLAYCAKYDPINLVCLICCGANVTDCIEDKTAYDIAWQELRVAWQGFTKDTEKPLLLGSECFAHRFWNFCILSSIYDGSMLKSQKEFYDNLSLIEMQWREFYDAALGQIETILTGHYKKKVADTISMLLYPQVTCTFRSLCNIACYFNSNHGGIVESETEIKRSLKRYDEVFDDIIGTYNEVNRILKKE